MGHQELLQRFKATDVYPVITPEFCRGRSPLAVLEAALLGGARVVQLRDKELPERYASAFRQLTDQYNSLFIINDSFDLALKYGADGVHLGRRDGVVAEVRKKAPDLLIGASANSLEEALAAQAAGASYIGLGPIYPTRTKVQAGDSLGTRVLREAVNRLQIPLVAIGGINRKNIAEVVLAGTRHVAMITAITEEDDVEQATRGLVKIVSSLGG